MVARDPIATALAARWRADRASVTRDDWPGVLVRGDGWRCILSRNVSAYVLQRRAVGASGKWATAPVRGGPSEWSLLFRDTCPEFCEGLAALPADPFEAALRLALLQGVKARPRRLLHYWSAPDYSGVLKVDANMRSVRDRSGTLYGVQWRSPVVSSDGSPEKWVTQAKGSCWPSLVASLADKTFFPDDPDASPEEIEARFCSLFEGLPHCAADGPWLVVQG